jgi:hypothetical protein
VNLLVSYASASMNQPLTQYPNEHQAPCLPSADDSRRLPSGHYHAGEAGAQHAHWSIDTNTVASRQVLYSPSKSFFIFFDKSLAASDWKSTPS